MDRPEDSLFEASGELDASKEIIIENLSKRDERIFIFHLLYAMDSFDYQASLESIVDNFCREFNLSVARDGSVIEQVRSIVDNRLALDDQIKPLLDNWRFDRLGVCTRLIIRQAIWELRNTDIDSAIIINEAIELSKCFAEDDAYKFINGLLDEWVKKNKTAE
ncbi:MAG: transcription antitermination factor NusB [Candidatus Babeliaceae bacterium]|jgi:N utilization substance protein B